MTTQTMRSGVFLAPGQIELRDVPVPEPALGLGVCVVALVLIDRLRRRRTDAEA